MDEPLMQTKLTRVGHEAENIDQFSYHYTALLMCIETLMQM